MIELNEPQVWTLIGLFAAALFGMLTLMSTMFARLLNARFDSLQAQLEAQIGGLRGEMNARFAKVESQINHLGRDVQALAKRVLPD